MKTVLLAGSHGQLGRCLQASCPEDVALIALDRDELDITDRRAVERLVADRRPVAILNAAAYTAVDKAESEPELARAVNADGAANLARAARAVGARLIHVSTDFVFDGRLGRPYRPDDTPSPLGVYGQTKHQGEQAVLAEHPDNSLILRTAWVYTAEGSNFVNTMLRLMNEREEIAVVADQIGTPTRADGLARAVWLALERELSGIHHWTDAGVASWYDFAVAIRDEAARLGLIERMAHIRPIRGEDYPTPARRPGFAVLDKHASWQALGITPLHWREALVLTLTQKQRDAV